MRRPERVVSAFGALGEARQPAFLAQAAHAFAPPRQDLVRIGLVADVPDQPVRRRVEDMVERNRQLDHAEPGAEMAAGLGHDVDQVDAQLVRQRRKLALRQPPQVGRVVDGVEKRRPGAFGHDRNACCRRGLAGDRGSAVQSKSRIASGTGALAGQLSGSGMNSSSSPGTMSKRPVFHSFFACSMRSREDDTKFHQV